MSEWKKGTGESVFVKLPDGTLKEVFNIEPPESLIERPSGVAAGDVKHVPSDTKYFTCPRCQMDIPDYAKKCSACGWTKGTLVKP